MKSQKQKIDALNQRIQELTLTKQKAVFEANSDAKRRVSDLETQHERRVSEFEANLQRCIGELQSTHDQEKDKIVMESKKKETEL